MRKFNFNFLVIFFKFNSINFNLNGFLYGQKVILQFEKIQLKLKRLILKKSEFFSLFFVIYFSKTGLFSEWFLFVDILMAGWKQRKPPARISAVVKFNFSKRVIHYKQGRYKTIHRSKKIASHWILL